MGASMNRLRRWFLRITRPASERRTTVPVPVPAPPPVVHAAHCSKAPVFVPLWAIGRRGSDHLHGDGFREWIMVHWPPEPCAICGQLVIYSTRLIRPKRSKSGAIRVYCSAEHKAEAVAGALEPTPGGPPKVKGPAFTPPKIRPCPRPDKRWRTDTEAQLRHHLADLFDVDPTLDAYLCVCGKWHAGHQLGPPVDPGQTIGAIARIVYTTETEETP